MSNTINKSSENDSFNTSPPSLLEQLSTHATEMHAVITPPSIQLDEETSQDYIDEKKQVFCYFLPDSFRQDQYWQRIFVNNKQFKLIFPVNNNLTGLSHKSATYIRLIKDNYLQKNDLISKILRSFSSVRYKLKKKRKRDMTAETEYSRTMQSTPQALHEITHQLNHQPKYQQTAHGTLNQTLNQTGHQTDQPTDQQTDQPIGQQTDHPTNQQTDHQIYQQTDHPTVHQIYQQSMHTAVCQRTTHQRNNHPIHQPLDKVITSRHTEISPKSSTQPSVKQPSVNQVHTYSTTSLPQDHSREKYSGQQHSLQVIDHFMSRYSVSTVAKMKVVLDETLAKFSERMRTEIHEMVASEFKALQHTIGSEALNLHANCITIDQVNRLIESAIRLRR